MLRTGLKMNEVLLEGLILVSLKSRALKFCFTKSYEVVYSPSLVKRDREEHFFYLIRMQRGSRGDMGFYNSSNRGWR